jgi:alpha-L-arabinofuranosidase
VWYKGDPTKGSWTEAPHLAEEQYNLEDALVVGQWLNVFLRKADVLKIACVAQIVNVISWMHTNSDGLLKFPSYDVFRLVSNNARGSALDVAVKGPEVETKQFDFVPVLDVSASYDEVTGNGAIFVVNRSQTDAIVTEAVWQSGSPDCIAEAWQLTGPDVKEVNTWDEPDRLRARPMQPPAIVDGRATLQLPPLSFTVLTTRSQLA